MYNALISCSISERHILLIAIFVLTVFLGCCANSLGGTQSKGDDDEVVKVMIIDEVVRR